LEDLEHHLRRRSVSKLQHATEASQARLVPVLRRSRAAQVDGYDVNSGGAAIKQALAQAGAVGGDATLGGWPCGHDDEALARRGVGQRWHAEKPGLALQERVFDAVLRQSTARSPKSHARSRPAAAREAQRRQRHQQR
jgi:hypothetical protein